MFTFSNKSQGPNERARSGSPVPSSLTQAKLRVSDPADPSEKEADRIADQVTRAPGSQPGYSFGGLRVDATHDKTGLIARAHQTAATSSSPLFVGPGAHQKISSLRGSGEPLPKATQSFFESRLGHDFSKVRIHHGQQAHEAAQAVKARAFTLGSDIAFRWGEYSPGSEAGRRLLAHELVHVAQGTGDATLHRAEVEDRDSVCSSLTDIKPDINTFVNGVLSSARSSPGVSPVEPFLVAVNNGTGGTGAVGPIETFVEGLPATKRFLPPQNLSGTRFAGIPSAGSLGIPGVSIPGLGSLNIYSAHTAGVAHVVGASAKINGICAGADKLGHFFQQGLQYFAIKTSPGSNQAAAESFGRGTEISRAGLGATGVYSNADLSANLAGLRFWEDLAANTSLSFDIASYITQDWNEYRNPNFYEASIAREVWAIQLTGSWSGLLGFGPALQGASVTLAATNTGTVTGSFTTTPLTGTTPMTGTITGTITYNTTSVSGSISGSVLHGSSGTHTASPVSGITIEFDWTDGTNSGKGIWVTTRERQLRGTLGTGNSRTNAGNFDIDRI